MINTFPKLFNKNPAPHKQRGSITIIFSLVITIIISIITLYGASSVQSNQRVMANSLREKQSFEAAESGIEYAIAHIKENGTTIVVDDDSNGFIDAYSNALTTNVVLGNGSEYSFVYSNPTASNFDIIQVSSTGLSDDDSVSRTITQLLLKLSYLENGPPAGFIARNNINLSGNVTIANTETGNTIWAGGAVTLGGSAATDGGSGISSDRWGLNSDVTQNDSNLSSLTGDEYFENFFGMTKATAKASANISYTDTGNINYSAILDGVVGQVIWIDHTGGGEARLSGNSTIGSPTQPVILIIDGNFQANGVTTIYGAVYVAQDWNNSGGGTLDIYGSAITEGSFSGVGTPNVIFSQNILDRASNLADYVKIPGSWRDY